MRGPVNVTPVKKKTTKGRRARANKNGRCASTSKETDIKKETCGQIRVNVSLK